MTLTTTPALSAPKSMLHTLTSLLLPPITDVELDISANFTTVLSRRSKSGSYILSGIAICTLMAATAILTTYPTDSEELTAT